jgi:hypothetical protein
MSDPLMILLDVDPRVAQETLLMAVAPTPVPPGAIDPATGRLLPLSVEERRACSEALGRALDAIAEITDATDTDETWREVFRGIDEGRPHRKLFEGMN